MLVAIEYSIHFYNKQVVVSKSDLSMCIVIDSCSCDCGSNIESVDHAFLSIINTIRGNLSWKSSFVIANQI